MDTVRMTIDGQPVEVPAGMTILEAARKADIYIPVCVTIRICPPLKIFLPFMPFFTVSAKSKMLNLNSPEKAVVSVWLRWRVRTTWWAPVPQKWPMVWWSQLKMSV